MGGLAIASLYFIDMFYIKSSQFSFTFVICEQTSQFVRSSVNDTSEIYTCLSHTADCTIFVFHSL